MVLNILLISVLAGFYFWNEKKEKKINERVIEVQAKAIQAQQVLTEKYLLAMQAVTSELTASIRKQQEKFDDGGAYKGGLSLEKFKEMMDKEFTKETLAMTSISVDGGNAISVPVSFLEQLQRAEEPERS